MKRSGLCKVAVLVLVVLFYGFWLGMATSGGEALETDSLRRSLEGMPVAITLRGPAVGESGEALPFSAEVLPLTSTLPLTFTWQATHHEPVTQVRYQATTTLTLTWTLSGAQQLTVTAANGLGFVVATRGVLIDPVGHAYLPLVLRAYPPGPVIHFFRADVEIADPGDTILLEWASSGATGATLYHLLPTGQFGNFWTVEPSASMSYQIPETWRNFEHFFLRVDDDEGLWVQAYLNIPLTCPDTWFFEPAPNECPAAPPLYSSGAEQPFEHGLMLWVGEQDAIYILFEDGGTLRWRTVMDQWDEGDPVDDPSIIPPPGFFQPVRGFGLVWREEPGIRDSLGWATAPEQGYETAVQRTSRWKYNDIYIRALDGGVWRLLPEGSGWEYIPQP
ncbi:MAG: hypothetical protein JW892_14500 [Anaerolineae bacterium]|nr:hypothetical protein [Anaerolineae bacterium]